MTNLNQYPQNPYQMNPYYPRQNQVIPNNGIIWVQGIEGAKAFQLAPNSNILLMDSESDGKFYIKVSDNVGMCTLRTFNYEEVTNQPTTPAIDLSEYVRKDELQQLIANVIGGATNEQSIPATESKSKRHATD